VLAPKDTRHRLAANQSRPFWGQTHLPKTLVVHRCATLQRGGKSQPASLARLALANGTKDRFTAKYINQDKSQ
jgi:hypothetical protein